MVPNERFKELLADIEPSPTTTSHSSTAHTNVRDHLRSHVTFKTRWQGDFLAGSYARDTSIRPKRTEDGHERPDIDIIVVTNYSTRAAPDDVLKELRDVLANKFNIERVNKRSVRLTMSNAEIDVVPVIEWGAAYQIPDRDLGHWKATNPPGHNAWSQNCNTAFGGRFKPLVKLFKWWRRENNTGKRPKGFILETLVALHAPANETHYGEAFTQMLEGIYSSYGSRAALDLKPSIDDPALPGNDILSKVSITDWKNFIDRVRVHAGYARRAQDSQDMDESTKLWRKLFGDRFKVTTRAASGNSLASFAVAPAATGASYTFPNAPAAPNKPRGFA